MESKLSIQPPVIAHRGASHYAPENTLAAFKIAKELGIKWLEFDVQMTVDNELVIFHDDEISRTTNGKGSVQDCTLMQLKALDSGSWFGSSFKDEKILTFQEVISFIQQENMAANIEIKVGKANIVKMAQVIVSVLEKNLAIKPFPFFISSFNSELLEEIVKIDSSLPIAVAYLMDAWNQDWDTLCDQLNCIAVDICCDIIDKDKVKEIVETGRLVLAYTVNDPQVAKNLFSWGVSAVFSDCPDRILSVL